jgi:hypothetical protein
VADPTDIAALNAGEKDLVNADFRGATLAGLSLSHRDFSGAKFDHAELPRTNLRRSILTRASFTQTNLSGANLDGCIATSTSFVHTNFDKAVLINASLRGAIFNNSNLCQADLRGADLQNVRLVEDNDLTGAVADETTRFDGAHVLRPMIKNPVFRFYRLERGRLIRKSEEESGEKPDASNIELARLGAREPIIRARETLASIRQQQGVSAKDGLIGHNNPPGGSALTARELDEVGSALNELSAEIESQSPNFDKIGAAKNVLRNTGNKIIEWVGKHQKFFFEEFFKEAGKNAAKPHVLATAYLIFSGQLSQIIQLITELFPV